MRTPWKLALSSAALAAVAVVAIDGVASAHINPSPPAVEAGTSATVGFTIEHGCDASPTTDIKIKLPETVTDAAPVDKTGWTSSLADGVIEFKGGTLPSDQEDHFDITFTAPAQAGDIRFPIIQTCEQGELAWIEIAAEGAAEPEHPAPTLKVTDGPPTSADLVPEAEGTDAPTAGGSVAAPTDSGVVAPVVATAPTTASSDDSSNTGTIVVVVVIVAIVLIGGGVVLARRRSTTS